MLGSSCLHLGAKAVLEVYSKRRVALAYTSPMQLDCTWMRTRKATIHIFQSASAARASTKKLIEQDTVTVSPSNTREQTRACRSYLAESRRIDYQLAAGMMHLSWTLYAG